MFKIFLEIEAIIPKRIIDGHMGNFFVMCLWAGIPNHLEAIATPNALCPACAGNLWPLTAR